MKNVIRVENGSMIFGQGGSISAESGTATGETGKTSVQVQNIKKIGKEVIFSFAVKATNALSGGDTIINLPWVTDGRYDFIGAVAGAGAYIFTINSSQVLTLNTGSIAVNSIVFVSGSYITTD